ncbi:MAG: hypothetical protein AB1656_01170 [Candidatus Omnitrophota bacterium]
MIAIGNFSFPEKTTSLQTAVIEAKSKVRREIRIQSLLRKENRETLQAALGELQASVEAFDRREADLSIHPGRYFYGRRRSLQIVPSPCDSLAFAELMVLTDDRYERGRILHNHDLEAYWGRADFALFNLGNWISPLKIALEFDGEASSLKITANENVFSLTNPYAAGQSLVIDSETRQTMLDGETFHAAADQNYPFLAPGSNHLLIHIEPMSAKVRCSAQYRDVWV